MATDPDQITDDTVQIADPGTVEVVDPAPQLSEVEQLAAEKGWSPKDAWRGKEDSWKPARDYLAARVDRGTESYREVRELRSTMDRTMATVERMNQVSVAKAREEAEARFAAAVESGDTQAAAQARDDVHRISAPVPSGPPPEAADFVARNPWFNTDPGATAFAKSVAEQQARAGKSAAEQIAEAERQTRARFPDLFPAEQRAAAKPAAVVNAPDTRTANARARERGFNDLPRSAQEAGRRLSGKMGFSLEEYAKTWLSENAA